jgi:peptide/nickel transport system ATP-binding protein
MTNKDLCIDIKDLSVEYRTVDGVVSAINGIDLQIERGKTLGLVGETGAGKTTLVCNLFAPLKQKVLYFSNSSLSKKIRGRKLVISLRYRAKCP